MPSQTLNLDTLKDVPLEKLVLQVLREHQKLTIWVSGGQEVIIEPKQTLQPLPVLNGYVPKDWKDAIYDVK